MIFLPPRGTSIKLLLTTVVIRNRSYPPMIQGKLTIEDNPMERQPVRRREAWIQLNLDRHPSYPMAFTLR